VGRVRETTVEVKTQQCIVFFMSSGERQEFREKFTEDKTNALTFSTLSA
jgi:hypothetical protein